MLCGRVLMMMTWSRILPPSVPECPHIQADDGSRGDTRHSPPGTAIVPAAPKYFLGFGNIFSVI